MKKNILKVLATAVALAVTVSIAPTTSLTAQAAGFNQNAHDDTVSGRRPDDLPTLGSGSSSSGSSESSTPAPAPKIENSSSSSNSGHGFNQNAQDTTVSGSRPNNIATLSGTDIAVNSPNNVVVNVPGVQKFRSVMNADHTVYAVYHCGISRASFIVTDDDGNVVTFSTVKLEQGEDGFWYENITLADGVDTKGLTVTVIKGDTSYLADNLSVSGIKLNGTVMLLTAPATDTE